MTLEEIITARLKSYAPLLALSDGRVFPDMSTQDPQFPCHVYARDGVETTQTVNTGSAPRLGRYTVRVETYGRSDAEVKAPAGEVVKALQGYSDSANGLQGCFHTDSESGTAEGGLRVVTQTFSAWFKPAP